MTATRPMHNPPHPGEFIRDIYLSELHVSVRDVAAKLQVAPSTLNRILQGRSRVTPEMALRLSRCLGRSAESWLAMQDAYDLWHARQQLDLSGITSVVAAGR
ncbi:HigA family addiction module antitoxin [Cyanobium sp. FGCU-6]|nr:HigA family addiction module antitoxin [Cyanobium sp. FGCU6]